MLTADMIPALSDNAIQNWEDVFTCAHMMNSFDGDQAVAWARALNADEYRSLSDAIYTESQRRVDALVQTTCDNIINSPIVSEAEDVEVCRRDRFEKCVAMLVQMIKTLLIRSLICSSSVL